MKAARNGYAIGIDGRVTNFLIRTSSSFLMKHDGSSVLEDALLDNQPRIRRWLRSRVILTGNAVGMMKGERAAKSGMSFPLSSRRPSLFPSQKFEHVASDCTSSSFP
mmetsp:Transcript_24506/g.56118  ORF Transcript_24506/g.56118 Transcript_24506/m.56118 type:complete len:107 (-) Transcript_24506:246-566(-)